MNTFLKYLCQNAVLEAQLEKAKAELAKADAVERALAARASRQADIINALVKSHPQMSEIGQICAQAVTIQKRRRSQIQILKLEVEQTRKSYPSDWQPLREAHSRIVPDRSPVVWY